jgi:flagellar motor switch/type III secretory pathway protein FliN
MGHYHGSLCHEKRGEVRPRDMTLGVRPFPWEALERRPRAEVEATARARRALAASFDLAHVVEKASALLGVPVEVQAREITLEGGLRASGGVSVTLATDGAPAIALDLEAGLAARIAARVAGRDVPWLDPSRPVPPEVAGATAAFLVALARRTSDRPWRLAANGPAGSLVCARFVVLIGAEVFSAAAAVSTAAVIPPARPFDRAALASLGEVPVSVPLVAATSLASRADLDALVVGSAWAPGDGWTIRRTLDGGWAGSAALVPPRAESGLAVRVEGLGTATTLVVTPGLAVSPWEARVSDDSSTSPDPSEPLGDADVVVRVEVATVTLPARSWAALTAGDVVTTGIRVGEPVTLRAGGVAFARGELCVVDGEIAVRIVERKGTAS